MAGATPSLRIGRVIMLEGMRRASQNWLGKIVVGVLFGFLILSFAVWGIGDIFRGFGVGTVAEVGKTEISTEAYRNAYQTQLQNWQREARRAITNEQARAAGLDRLVLSRLVSEAALDQRARELGLAMAERDIAQTIVNDPNFTGPTGKFDRQRFNNALREAGYPSEQRFVQEQRQSYLRRQLALSIAGDATPPRTLLEAAHRYASETRSVEYFVLPPAFAGEIPAPSPEALQTFFEARKAQFRAPEYRQITTLAVTPTSVADPAGVSDEDARKLYDQIKDKRFSKPERRVVQQIVFDTQEQAEAARKRIEEGAAFDAIATERGLSPKDISLGSMAWTDFVDPNVAEAAFKTPEGAVSAPVKSSFGTALLRVEKIEPKSVKPFEEVTQTVKQEVAMSRARDEVQRIRDKIEDERTSGKTLADAAKAAGLKVRVIEAVDQGGRNPKGEQVADLPEAETLLRAAFASDIGVDNELLTTRDNGYVWFEIGSIDPARDRKLDEVRERVVAAWRSDEVARILREKADELLKRINAGESVEAVAKSVGLQAQLATDVKRAGSEKLPAPAVARVYTVPVGAAGSSADGENRVVFKVLDSVTPPYDPEDPTIKALKPRLEEAMTQDLLAQYVARVQDELGVSINEAAVRSAVGGGDVN